MAIRRGSAGVERLRAVLPEVVDRLEAEPEGAGNVDPGLDREDVAHLQRRRVAGAQIGRLVDLQPEAVARPVQEALALAGSLDHLAGLAVDLLAGHAGRHGGDGRVVGGEYHGVGLLHLGGGRRREEDAGEVGEVAVDEAAEVEQQRGGRVDRRVARLVVGERAVRARGDDRSGCAGCPCSRKRARMRPASRRSVSPSSRWVATHAAISSASRPAARSAATSPSPLRSRSSATIPGSSSSSRPGAQERRSTAAPMGSDGSTSSRRTPESTLASAGSGPASSLQATGSASSPAAWGSSISGMSSRSGPPRGMSSPVGRSRLKELQPREIAEVDRGVDPEGVRVRVGEALAGGLDAAVGAHAQDGADPMNPAGAAGPRRWACRCRCRRKETLPMLRDARVATRIPVRDLARARAFYADRLGLEPAEERPGGLLYRCAGGEFALFESAGAASGDHTQMGFDVDDIEATVADLRRRGLEFEDVDMPGLEHVDGITEVPGNYPSKGDRRAGGLVPGLRREPDRARAGGALSAGAASAGAEADEARVGRELARVVGSSARARGRARRRRARRRRARRAGRSSARSSRRRERARRWRRRSRVPSAEQRRGQAHQLVPGRDGGEARLAAGEDQARGRRRAERSRS